MAKGACSQVSCDFLEYSHLGWKQFGMSRTGSFAFCHMMTYPSLECVLLDLGIPVSRVGENNHVRFRNPPAGRNLFEQPRETEEAHNPKQLPPQGVCLSSELSAGPREGESRAQLSFRHLEGHAEAYCQDSYPSRPRSTISDTWV